MACVLQLRIEDGVCTWGGFVFRVGDNFGSVAGVTGVETVDVEGISTAMKLMLVGISSISSSSLSSS